MAETLILGSAFSLSIGLLYLYVGSVVAKKPVSPEARPALTSFVLWWYGLGAVSLVGGATNLLGAYGALDLALLTTLTYALFLVLCLSLWGLITYLVFVFSGRTLQKSLGAFYLGFYFFLVYLLVAAKPVGIKTGRWSTTLDYANQVHPIFVTLFLVLLLLPQAIGSLAYLSLAFRTKERAARYRIVMVSVSIFVWFFASFIVSQAGIAQTDAWQVASKMIALGASVAILAAYRPPAWIQRWLEEGQSVSGAM